MPYSDIPAEYKPWCEEQAARTHETEWEYWHQHAPEDYRLFQTEYKRLKAAGQERGALAAAEAHVKALRAQRAAAEKAAAEKAAKKGPTRRRTPRSQAAA